MIIAGGLLNEAQAGLLARLEASGGRLTLRTGEVTTTDIATLTQHTKAEFAVIRTAAGQRQLLQLGRMGGRLPEDTTRLVIHSHPGGMDAIRFGVSGEDVEALGLLGQRRSLIVNSEGTVAAFGSSGDSVILKQYLFGAWRYFSRP